MLTSRNLTYEKQSKFIQDRIASVEKYFSELCSAFALYARKTARIRDSGDEISKTLKLYSDNENVNKTLSSALAEVSTTLQAIEEYRNARAQRLEIKVVGELSQYEGICKHFRSEIKHTLSLRESETSRKKALDRMRERNPLNRPQIMHAETEFLKVSSDVSRTAKELEDQTDLFEKQKLQNIKSILKTFIEVELSFLTKALELYSVAYQQINNIDCESDLNVFQQMRGTFDTDYRSQIQLLDEQSSVYKHSAHGSIASLLSQQERNKSKAPSLNESQMSTENSDESSDITEESKE